MSKDEKITISLVLVFTFWYVTLFYDEEQEIIILVNTTKYNFTKTSSLLIQKHNTTFYERQTFYSAIRLFNSHSNSYVGELWVTSETT